MLPLLFAHVLPYLDLVIEYWIILVTAVGPVPLYDKIAAFFFNYQIRHQIRRCVLLGGRLLTDEPVGERADTRHVNPVDPTFDAWVPPMVENVTRLLPVSDRPGLRDLVRLNPISAGMVQERLDKTLLLGDGISPDGGYGSAPFLTV